MDAPVFKKVTNTINIISLLQLRCREFKKELNFFYDRWPSVSEETGTISQELYLSALRRLGHEVMFLTIETFSLHEGITKKDSLLSSSIRDNGVLLTKVDKSDSVSASNFTYIGDPVNQGDIDSIMRVANKRHIDGRKNLRKESGITSKKHEDINDWMESITKNEDISELKTLRDNFAHSLNDIEKIENGMSFFDAQCIKSILKIISNILESYKKRFNELLTYTCSTCYDGVVGCYYDSFSRLKSYDLNKSIGA